jgi:ribonuclease VapC
MDFAIDLAVDTSALMAILLGEQDAADLLEIMLSYKHVGISAANRAELLIVVGSRLGEAGIDRAKTLMDAQQIRAIEVDEKLADAAADAFRRFGKGRHPAGLNFGDCFSYALATRQAAPLLFKGEDFSQTDVRAALQRAG